jgi:hypothetical protein
MKYLDNPKKKKHGKGKKRLPASIRRRGYSTWREWMAHIRKKKGGENTMAKKKHHKKKGHHKKHKTNPITNFHRGGKRHYRRNPPISMRGFVPMLLNGVTDAAEIIIGKAVTRTLPALIGLPHGSPLNLLGQAVTAIGAGYLGHSFISANAGKMILAGGLAAPLEDLIKGANIPLLSPALGEEIEQISGYSEDEAMASYPMIGAYPMGEMSPEEEEEAVAMQ